MIRVLTVFALLLGAWPLKAETPASLVGQFLYFDEGLEDYLVFLDGSGGEERDIGGDVDPFTYTYDVTGATTAKVTVTFAVGRYDVWTLTWTGTGAGTFVREEFRNAALDDTDTGGFEESGGNAAPPTGLAGIRLEETIDGEDERFEFLTDTKGREFEPGDADPFTYVHENHDATTIRVVATYGPEDFDEVFLTFESETGGTFLLGRFRDREFVKDKRGQFRLELNTQTVDLLIHDDKGGMRGGDFFNLDGIRQTIKTRLPDDRPRRLRGEIENDGDDDSITARASRGSRKLSTRVFSVNPRRNITATATAGGTRLGEIGHDTSERIEIELRRKGRGRVNRKGWLQGTSDAIPGAADRVYYEIATP
jgi:hypothetical protein